MIDYFSNYKSVARAIDDKWFSIRTSTMIAPRGGAVGRTGTEHARDGCERSKATELVRYTHVIALIEFYPPKLHSFDFHSFGILSLHKLSFER